VTYATAYASLAAPARAAAPALWRGAIAALATFLVLYHLYTGLYGTPTNVIHLPVHLMVAFALLFMLNPLGRRWDAPLNAWTAVDLVCIAGSAWVLGYFLLSIDDWQLRFASLRPIDSATAILTIALVFEAVRRTVGWSLIVIAGVFITHALYAPWFPGVFFGPPASVETLLQTLFVGDAGIFGVPVLVVAQYVVLFLLFGRLLQATGAGAFFARLAFALFGHRIGGPAKAAVVSSALFGTVSGSGVSNVLTTGSFTIPMMLRLGYRPPFAGGVEASAAVGGAIMPPVMGAVAFMMAEFMGVPYIEIALAAAIPAILYYFAIYWTVHFEARKLGLGRLDRALLPDPWRIMLRQGYLLLPLALIVALLLIGWSIILVIIVTIAGTFLLSWATPATRITPTRLADAIEGTARATVSLSATCACAGIIIGAIFATGLSFQISQAVIAMASDRLWLLLIVAGLIALVLGTGLTASAVYITMVATVIPILKLAGVNDMGAHMFAFYYGVVSDITPPTALAAVAAAGIARANPISTMLEASRLGLGAYVVPVLFVYAPALLMIGTPLEILTASVTAGLGLLALSAALAGYFRSPLVLWRRLGFFVAAACLIVNHPVGDLAGILLFALTALPDLVGRRRESSVAWVATEARPSRLPPGLQRWLARRVEREEAGEGEELIAARTGEDRGLALQRFLAEDDSAGRGPADAGLWSGWAVLVATALVLGLMGARSLHATAPLAFLAVLALTSLGLVAGLTFAFRRMPVERSA